MYRLIRKYSNGAMLTLSRASPWEQAKWLYLWQLSWGALIYYGPRSNPWKILLFKMYSHYPSLCDRILAQSAPLWFTMSSWITAQNIGSVQPVHSVLCEGLSNVGSQSIRKWPVLYEKRAKGVEWRGYMFIWQDCQALDSLIPESHNEDGVGVEK